MLNSKKNIVSLLFLLGLPVVLLFQNCGQQGSLQVSGGELSANAAQAIADDIPRDVDDEEAPGDGGMVVIQPPQLPVQPPSNPGVVDGPKDSPISSPISMPSSPEDGGSDQPAGSQKLGCDQIEIADIKLSIAEVSSNSSCLNKKRQSNSGRQEQHDDAEFEIVQDDATLSLSKPVLKLRALKSIEVKQLFVRLNESGNQVLGLNNVVMDLVTPSAEQSGLKFQLKKSVQIKTGQEYNLSFEIHAEDQIVANPVKCLFKPVVKSVLLVPTN